MKKLFLILCVGLFLGNSQLNAQNGSFTSFIGWLSTHKKACFWGSLASACFLATAIAVTKLRNNLPDYSLQTLNHENGIFFTRQTWFSPLTPNFNAIDSEGRTLFFYLAETKNENDFSRAKDDLNKWCWNEFLSPQIKLSDFPNQYLLFNKRFADILIKRKKNSNVDILLEALRPCIVEGKEELPDSYPIANQILLLQELRELIGPKHINMIAGTKNKELFIKIVEQYAKNITDKKLLEDERFLVEKLFDSNLGDQPFHDLFLTNKTIGEKIIKDNPKVIARAIEGKMPKTACKLAQLDAQQNYLTDHQKKTLKEWQQKEI
ncbi:MAG: hypothetical protein JW725_01230 [Candidatus Babeliaceae bacterium]|nr:hypothetical protein [Candidatus Babeliaceae bacterium]